MIRISRALPIFVAALCCSTQARALPYAAFRPLNVDSRIRNTATFCTFQDKTGIVWAGTEDGLVRYDGAEARVFHHHDGDPSSLGSNLIRRIIAAPKGRLWVGTFNGGVDLFDPVTRKVIKRFRSNPNATSGNLLQSNQIWSLYQDSKGYLWIGYFNGGLTKLDPSTDTAMQFHHRPGDPSSLGPASVNALYTDHEGHFWVGTSGGGLQEFNPVKNNFRSFRHHSNDPSSLSDNRVTSIGEDSKGNLWVGTVNGINEKLARGFKRYYLTSAAKKHLAEDSIKDILDDGTGSLLVATAGYGLARLDPATGHATLFPRVTGHRNSEPGAVIWQISRDSNGLLWLASSHGVRTLDPRSFTFDFYDTKSLTSNGEKLQGLIDTYSITIDKTGAIWVGEADNVTRLKLNTDGDTKIRIYNLPWHEINNFIRMIKQTGPATYWLGIENMGLFQLNAKTGKITSLNTLFPKPANQTKPGVDDMVRGKMGKLWLGMYRSGVMLYDPDTAHFKSFASSHNKVYPLTSDRVSSLLTDNDKILWVATYSGLDRLIVTPTGKQHEPLVSTFLPNHFIFSLYKTDSHTLFAATDQGLYRISLGTGYQPGKITRINLGKGTTGNIIFTIGATRSGNLWLGTGYGLVRYNPATGSYFRFTTAQGLPFNAFSRDAVARLNDGRLVFGGEPGIIVFDPEKVHPNDVPPRVLVTSALSYQGETRHTYSIIPDEPLRFSYPNHLIVFRFAALSYTAPRKNSYAYRLLGFSKNWVHAGSQSEATFTNLDPGHYIFEVKGTNADGIWNRNPAKLTVIIAPPWWKTWWAYAIYIVFAALFLGGYVITQRRKLALAKAINRRLSEADEIKNRFVEQLREQVNKATENLRNNLDAIKLKNIELDIAHRRALDASHLKSQFLADMSHEIRTPMNGILGFAALLSKTKLSKDQSEYLQTIRNSGEALLATINRVLNVSRSEAGKLIFDEIDFDLLEYVEDTLDLMTPIAYSKNLELILDYSAFKSTIVRGDPIRLRQVLINLVGNAIKFTRKGYICVKIETLAETEFGYTIGIDVTDTGVGIAEKDLDRLFIPYSRLEQPDMETTGTGLGLAICRKMLDLMGGTINVRSKLGSGTTFELTVPLMHATQIQQTPVIPSLDDKKIAVYAVDSAARQALTNILEWSGAGTAILPSLDDEVTIRQCDLLLLWLQNNNVDLTRTLRELRAVLPDKPPAIALAAVLDRPVLRRLTDQYGILCCPKTTHRRSLLREIYSTLHKTQHDIVTTHVDANRPLEDRRILVVDDNRIDRHLMAGLLDEAGAHVEQCDLGSQAIERIEYDQWDMVVLDLQMPGMDGFETSQYIRNMDGPTGRTPIIGVTSDPDNKKQQAAQEAGINALISKSSASRQLVLVARRMFEKSS